MASIVNILCHTNKYNFYLFAKPTYTMYTYLTCNWMYMYELSDDLTTVKVGLPAIKENTWCIIMYVYIFQILNDKAQKKTVH